MTQPTPNDTPAPASVWFELAAVEIEIGTAGHIVKLPPVGPGVLEPWSIRDTHISPKNIAGKPRQILTVCFGRAITAGEPIAQKARPIEARPAAVKAPPPRAAAVPGTRRLQPGPTVGAPQPLAVAPSDVAAAVESTVAGVVDAVIGTVDQVLSGLGVHAPTPAPVSIPAGAACACPEPLPAVENSSAAAVPCRGCGGWINNAQTVAQPTA